MFLARATRTLFCCVLCCLWGHLLSSSPLLAGGEPGSTPLNRSSRPPLKNSTRLPTHQSINRRLVSSSHVAAAVVSFFGVVAYDMNTRGRNSPSPTSFCLKNTCVSLPVTGLWEPQAGPASLAFPLFRILYPLSPFFSRIKISQEFFKTHTTNQTCAIDQSQRHTLSLSLSTYVYVNALAPPSHLSP